MPVDNGAEVLYVPMLCIQKKRKRESEEKRRNMTYKEFLLKERKKVARTIMIQGILWFAVLATVFYGSIWFITR
jgi:hypothetical protein